MYLWCRDSLRYRLYMLLVYVACHVTNNERDLSSLHTRNLLLVCIACMYCLHVCGMCLIYYLWHDSCICMPWLILDVWLLTPHYAFDERLCIICVISLIIRYKMCDESSVMIHQIMHHYWSSYSSQISYLILHRYYICDESWCKWWVV